MSTSVITFNGSPRATVYQSSTTLQTALQSADLVVPGTLEVAVSNAETGGSLSASLILTISPASYLNPLPTISQLNPSFAQAGAGPFSLSLSGSGFIPGSVVNWNGQPLQTAFQSSSLLFAEVPASDVAAKGTAQVSVTNAPPGGGTSANVPFNIQ